MTITRRHFLKVMGAGAACTAALPGCGVTAETIEAGNAVDLAEGVSKVDGTDVLLGKDADGIYAMTSICTHLGCNMNDEGGVIDADAIECGSPCGHGSRFAFDGAVTAGPASAPLRHWQVTVAEDGSISVAIGTEVDAATRVAVA
jgi:Rieske Fe-S protein